MKKLTITGNVGQDATIRVNQSGDHFATFSVGVSVGTKLNPKTDWVNVTCNGKLSDVARNFVKKGTKVLIEGFPGVHAWNDKDGNAQASLKVFAHSIEFMSRPSDDKDLPTAEGVTDESTVSDIDASAIPF